MVKKSTTEARREYVERQRASEPRLAEDNYNERMHRYLGYHNTHTDAKTLRKWITRYAETIDTKFVPVVTRATDFEVRSVAMIAHAEMAGSFLTPLHRTKLRSEFHRIIEKYEHEQPVVKQVAVAEAKPDKTTLLTKHHRAEVDCAIDEFCTNDTPFSMKGYIASNHLPGPVARAIGQSYVNLLKELKEAVEGNDPQLKEAYSHFGKVKLKRFLALVQQIIADCAQQVVTAKAPRKARAVKEKPAAVLVAKLKYLKEFPDLKLTSEKPTSIIGAKTVWLYDTAKRKMFVYHAEGTNKLSVKGTTLLNWDAKRSQVKTIRKPEEFLSGSLAAKAIQDRFDKLSTKPQNVNGRTNEFCVILRVF